MYQSDKDMKQQLDDENIRQVLKTIQSEIKKHKIWEKQR